MISLVSPLLPARPKGSDAFRFHLRADELIHASVRHHKVVDHALGASARDSAQRTGRFSLEDAKVVEEVGAVFVGVGGVGGVRKVDAAEAALIKEGRRRR